MKDATLPICLEVIIQVKYSHDIHLHEAHATRDPSLDNKRIVFVGKLFKYVDVKDTVSNLLNINFIATKINQYTQKPVLRVLLQFISHQKRESRIELQK